MKVVTERVEEIGANIRNWGNSAQVRISGEPLGSISHGVRNEIQIILC